MSNVVASFIAAPQCAQTRKPLHTVDASSIVVSIQTIWIFHFLFYELKIRRNLLSTVATRDHLVECIFDAIAIELCSALCLYGFVAQIMGTATTHKCTRTTLSLRNHTQTWLTSKRLLFLHFRRWLGGRWRPFKNLVSIWTAVTFIRPISCEQ